MRRLAPTTHTNLNWNLLTNRSFGTRDWGEMIKRIRENGTRPQLCHMAVCGCECWIHLLVPLTIVVSYTLCVYYTHDKYCYKFGIFITKLIQEFSNPPTVHHLCSSFWFAVGHSKKSLKQQEQKSWILAVPFCRYISYVLVHRHCIVGFPCATWNCGWSSFRNLKC